MYMSVYEVELDLTEMACVSSNVRRTFHVPSGVRVQRSISERSVSYPNIFLSAHNQCDVPLFYVG